MGEWRSRDEAQAVPDESTRNKNLKKRACAVEAAMRTYAEKPGEGANEWAVVGPRHDFDYEGPPDLADHTFRGAGHLRRMGMPAALVEGVPAHAENTGAAREAPGKKAIFAVDGLSGLIVAVALVRPSNKLAHVTVDSVTRQWDEKGFAAGVDRELIERGARQLGVPLEEHAATVLEAAQDCVDEPGL